jgi:hypothetical protein
MMARVAKERGDGRAKWYLRNDELLAGEFEADLTEAIQEQEPVCVAATAFALVNVLDAMDAHGSRFVLPSGSRVMETGGFKGRTRQIDREELHAKLRDRFTLSAHAIISEYGMTELTSQYYDVAPPAGYKASPPWLRTRVVAPDRATLPNGELGALLHVDLANRSSCIAIQTEDLGLQAAEGLVLLGREVDAPPRGCSLDAEEVTAWG